ncbi:MAG: hypothetical protein OXG39_12570 [Chloroflexi bacterium]|nr:hypothetical protein [Chloroflexota bacterium]
MSSPAESPGARVQNNTDPSGRGRQPEALETVSKAGRFFAVLAYIVPVLGGLVGLALDGRNPLTQNHARQSIAAVVALILSFLLWAVVGYLIGLVPIAGPIVSISLFSLVVAMLIFMAINWIISLLVALRGQERTIPFANRIINRVFADDRKATSRNTTG